MSAMFRNMRKILVLPPRHLRLIHTESNAQEVRIPMPLGQLAGKWWGAQNKRPIVALHGWQDSSGSFDKLAPIISQDIPILALDLPGHGFSYKLPQGMRYHHGDISILLMQLVKFFEWDKISLMGHSLGAILGFSFGSLFPQNVDFLVCLDCVHPFINPRKLQSTKEGIEQFLKYDSLLQSDEEPPSYTIEEMKQKLHLATKKSVGLEAAESIIVRNIAPSKKNPGKYYFNRDHRVKVDPYLTEDPNEIIKAASNVTFPLLILKSREGSYLEEGSLFQDVHKILLKASVDCQFQEIPGTHHAHLNDPDVTAYFISKFLKRHGKQDRTTSGVKAEIIHEGTAVYRKTDMFDCTFVM